jgi:ribosomal protein L32
MESAAQRDCQFRVKGNAAKCAANGVRRQVPGLTDTREEGASWQRRCIFEDQTSRPSTPESILRIATIMASLRAPSASFLSAFLPVVRASLAPQQSVQRIPLLRQIQQQLNATLLPTALVPIPALLGQLWDGLLKAVPKKKTSHMKKRHRQMAGKALKDVTALNKCSACGRLKRAHVLCPHCVLSVFLW